MSVVATYPVCPVECQYPGIIDTLVGGIAGVTAVAGCDVHGSFYSDA